MSFTARRVLRFPSVRLWRWVFRALDRLPFITPACVHIRHDRCFGRPGRPVIGVARRGLFPFVNAPTFAGHARHLRQLSRPYTSRPTRLRGREWFPGVRLANISASGLGNHRLPRGQRSEPGARSAGDSLLGQSVRSPCPQASRSRGGPFRITDPGVIDAGQYGTTFILCGGDELIQLSALGLPRPATLRRAGGHAGERAAGPLAQGIRRCHSGMAHTDVLMAVRAGRLWGDIATLVLLCVGRSLGVYAHPDRHPQGTRNFAVPAMVEAIGQERSSSSWLAMVVARHQRSLTSLRGSCVLGVQAAMLWMRIS